MKSYIIRLSNYSLSRDMAQHAMTTGQQQGWELYFFEGVDGLTVDVMPVKINTADAKCKDSFNRPGVKGCFLSHWALWKHCVDINETIGIFEHDVEFIKAPVFEDHYTDILKLEGFDRKKARPAGEWFEGARAYIIAPQGARKLLTWVDTHGCLPADVQIGHDAVDIVLNNDNIVRMANYGHGKDFKHTHSFTWNLENMKD